MKITTILLALSAATASLAQDTDPYQTQPRTDDIDDTLTISIAYSAIGTSTIQPLLSFTYSPTTLIPEITSYDAPPDPPTPHLLRLGPSSSTTTSSSPEKLQFTSSTTTTSTLSFSKGHAPIFIVHLDSAGTTVLSVAVSSAAIDAGYSRDFGPKVQIVRQRTGPVPYLNRPMVLKEGKVEEVVKEKSLLQKYWWVGLLAVVLMGVGGGEK